MTTNAEYMLFAMSAYVRTIGNQAPVPQGWDEVLRSSNNLPSGFAAVAYQNSTTGEIVIAYSGTDFGSLDGIKRGNGDIHHFSRPGSH